MKYIDAEKLIAEIERLNALVSYESKDRHDEGLHDAYKAVKNVITSLQQEQPSLPSDIDKAAEEYSENILANNEDLQDAIEDAFKEGAKWMARQGVTLNLSIDELSCGAYNSCVEQGLTSEDDVIIQIRKKQ